MSAKDDGGPAFPTSSPYEGNGMSLRDWFAGQALPMVMETMPSPSAFKSAAPEVLAQAIASTAARWSYAVADAMLAERSK